jgi:transcription factor C subunit 3
VATAINRFYSQQCNDADGLNGGEAGDDSGPAGDGSGPTVDGSFVEQVWTWLTSHPEISVGYGGDGNHLSFSEIEARNSSIADTTGGELDATVPPAHVNSISPNALAPAQPISASLAPLRVYASKTRMWYAAAGHGPDPSRITRLEFQCLSLIAARREQGIFLTELVQMTGQDKRSLPSRTQRLADKGYIIRVSALLGKARSCFCILKRYESYLSTLGKNGTLYSAAGVLDGPAGRTQTALIAWKETESSLRQMFHLLAEHRILTWDDIKRQLVCFHPSETSLSLDGCKANGP